VTSDEIAPCPHGVFECAGDKEMEESIFIDDGLQGVDGDEDEPLLPSTLSHEPVPASTLKAEALQATTSSQQLWRRHGLRRRSSLSQELPLTFRRHIHLSRS
jgi:hypothetical protein